jgi:hypothetical protein
MPNFSHHLLGGRFFITNRYLIQIKRGICSAGSICFFSPAQQCMRQGCGNELFFKRTKVSEQRIHGDVSGKRRNNQISAIFF